MENMKFQMNKIKPESMPISEEEFVELCDNTGFTRLPIEAAHIFMLKTLIRSKDAPKHNDPFDRMLLAQAKYKCLNLITHDSQLPYYGENCVMRV